MRTLESCFHSFLGWSPVYPVGWEGLQSCRGIDFEGWLTLERDARIEVENLSRVEAAEISRFY